MDERDYVYGILSMTATLTTSMNRRGSAGPSRVPGLDGPPVSILTADHAPCLLVDYSRTVTEVFTDTAEYVMQLHDSLDVILFACQTKRNRVELPSWVPDWETIRPNLDFDWILHEPVRSTTAINWSRIHGDMLAAASNTQFNVFQHYLHSRPKMKFISDDAGRKLKCRGTVLGRLKVTSSAQNELQSRLVLQARAFMDFSNILSNFRSGLHTRIENLRGFKEIDFRARPVPSPGPLDVFKTFFGMGDFPTHRTTSSVVRSLCKTPCLVPESAASGDVVALLRGASLPVVIRASNANSNTFTVIGPLISSQYIEEEAARVEAIVSFWIKDSNRGSCYMPMSSPPGLRAFLRYFRPEEAVFVGNIFRTFANIPLDLVLTAETVVSVLTQPNAQLNTRLAGSALFIGDGLARPTERQCDGTANAWMTEDNDNRDADIYICEDIFDWPSIEDIANPPQTSWARDSHGQPRPGYSCAGLGDFDSDWMKTVGSTILHEYIHWGYLFIHVPGWYEFIRVNDQGWRAIDDYSGPNPPNGYGPYRAKQIKDIYGAWDQAFPATVNNVDNYVYYALSKYWSWRCDRQFGPTPSDRDAHQRVRSGFRPHYS
ncbi:hypothetical protein Z517_07677 [Fonsecaea pedrosoi CBS 271.37]|uniref:Uncharacterized protein n=1 Tax=Fonsecaea pedrosoi CBS 271.37 TaxID=1442368 RepID=A0A0D2GZD6_9EURO|nr:uncharacterized protein Z517_07677 [Fonsecaea pedrosoi CBS 271.37]KIW77844.1 hypothetical protein Z517_07677 [Fonsecaea pedrosoi CBS 271.37]